MFDCVFDLISFQQAFASLLFETDAPLDHIVRHALRVDLFDSLQRSMTTFAPSNAAERCSLRLVLQFDAIRHDQSTAWWADKLHESLLHTALGQLNARLPPHGAAQVRLNVSALLQR